jgi:hypothetical protein
MQQASPQNLPNDSALRLRAWRSQDKQGWREGENESARWEGISFKVPGSKFKVRCLRTLNLGLWL